MNANQVKSSWGNVFQIHGWNRDVDSQLVGEGLSQPSLAKSVITLHHS